jgi:hypothetical protein
MGELYTTFALCKQHDACESGYKKLAKALGGVRTYGKYTPIPLLKILETNGLGDAVWALRAVPEEQVPTRDRVARIFACDCAESVLLKCEAEYPNDKRPRQAIEVARRYALGKATQQELYAAQCAAWEAARYAARYAALDVTRGAAWDAAWYAAWDAEANKQEAFFMNRIRESAMPDTADLPGGEVKNG